VTAPSTEEAGQTYLLALAAAANPPASASSAIRLAAAVRALVELANANDADDELREEVASEVERLVSTLAAHGETSHYSQSERLAGAAGFFLAHPVIGPINPLAPGIKMTPVGAELIGEVTYGPPYEGPRNFVHGGHIEAGFDAILAMTAGMHGRAGMTKSLQVEFIAPTPLNTPVWFVGTIEERKERSTMVRAELLAGNQLCARGKSEQVMRRKS
jgi:acyl-coenzyme A thioesterase PaaI-like protein